MTPRNQVESGTIIARAKQAIASGDVKYARFLCYEALSIDPENIAVRKELRNMRKLAARTGVVGSNLSFFANLMKMVFHKNTVNYKSAITDIEKMLDAKPSSELATVSIIRMAYDAGFYKLVMFLYDETVDEISYELDDMLTVASACIKEKNFDKAAAIAKRASLMEPDNEKAKDILWKASVEKHMNADVRLMTVDNGTRFVPPKIDNEKIFISSRKIKGPVVEKAGG